MRIISGKYRGRQIVPPKNFKARPTTDFAKESLFNILNNSYDIDEVTVLDLFSGTGSISYEFASRGSQQVVCVELNQKYHTFISRTAEKMKLEQIKVVRANAFQFLKTCRIRFDIVFADPPFDMKGVDTLADRVFENDLLNSGGQLIIEHSANVDFSENSHFVEKRTYGQVNFSFFDAD